MSDAPKLWFCRAGDFLAATDEKSLEFIRKLGDGEERAFKSMKVRSLKFHKRYWAMLDDIYPHITEIDISLTKTPAMMPIQSAEDLHTALKLISGHCWTKHIQGTPYVLRVPKPTNFADLSAEEWSEIYPRFLDAIHQRALPQIEVREVQGELMRLAS